MLAINKNHPLLPIPKINHSLLHWQNALANKQHSINVQLENEVTHYNISLLSDSISKSSVKFGILFEIAAIPVPVWFSEWLLEARIKEFIADGDISKVPVDLRAELVERALKPLLEPLIKKTQVKIHVLNLLTHKPSKLSTRSLAFEFTDQLNNVVSITVVVHKKLANRMLEMMSYWPSRVPHPWQNYTTSLWLEVGSVNLVLQQLAQVKLADIILLEREEDIENNKILLRNGADHVYRATLNNNQLIIKSGIITMSDDIQNEVLDSINDIPVRLCFDVGEITLPFHNIQQLTEGTVIDLNFPITPMVTIRSNHKVIGTGELVDIDGKKGVRISQLFSVVSKENSNG